ncbi:DUF547 domain-containing protein [Polaribacter sp.]|uniref:DUF547 domain-containing protein n=1 Tax=Polaribacter sp. TaxID=1920175 RepID=UPI003EF8235F
MKYIYLVLIGVLFVSQSNAQTAIFNELLQKHVTKDGVVDYKNFDGVKLKQYVTYLEKNSPDKSWSLNKQKAFWINAYNAYTIYLILHAIQAKNIKSITDIKEKGNTAWKIPFANIGGKTYTLDHIEHQILRKNFSDPKIHVGVNCASVSCPKLSNIAFTEENIDRELTRLMKEFINDSSKNKITQKSVQLSSIFDWFKEDFTKNGSVVHFINKYSATEISSGAKVSYLKYNWSLNGK